MMGRAGAAETPDPRPAAPTLSEFPFVAQTATTKHHPRIFLELCSEDGGTGFQEGHLQRGESQSSCTNESGRGI